MVPILESGYLYNILLADSFHNYNDNYRQFLVIEEKYGFMIVLEFGDSEENGVLTNAVGISVRAEKFYPQLREIAKEFFHCLVGPVMGNRVVLLVPYEKNFIDYDERVHILTKTRNMVYKLETRTDSRFRAGIGRIKEEDNLRESYSEALQALREADSHVVHVNDIPTGREEEEDYPEELESRYLRNAMKRDIAGTSECVDKIFEWMESHCGGSIEEMQIRALELLIKLEQKAFASGRMRSRQKKHYIQELRNCTDRQLLKKWFWEQTRDISRSVEENRERQSESVMEKAKAYIRENFQKELTLDEVSKIVDISPYYFSKLFKQETGENFIEYLTKVRMKNAEILLRDSHYSIKEVCIMSGYGDPNYFSRIFKKYEGVTPSEYRERLG